MTNEKKDDIKKTASEVLGKTIDSITNDISKEKSKIISFATKLVTYPTKVIASFITAPFLILKITISVKDTKRRAIAATGLAIALFCSYIATSFLGEIGGALLISSTIGVWTGIGFFFGSFFSEIISFIFALIIFNAISFIFLKISSMDVNDHLSKISN